MKKHIIALSFFFLSLCSLTAYAQDNWTTVYTPTGLSVEALVRYEFNANELAKIEQDAADWINAYNSNAVRIAPASRKYNCHSYAWHYSDGGDNVWINQKTSLNQQNISKYWLGSSQTYVPTNYIEAQKVFYPYGDHSAITTSNPNIFESKWGAWPRYRHAFNDCPYVSNSLQCYKVGINGNPILCNGSNSYYTVVNIPNGSYNWSGINVNASGSSSTGTVYSTVNQGGGRVIVSIYSPYSNTTINASKSIWIGVPLYQIVSDSLYEPLMPGIAIIDNDNYDPYSFQLVNNINWSYSGPLTNFVGDLYKAKFRTARNLGEGFITANVSNTCGSMTQNFFYEVIDPFRLLVSPNPAVNQIDVFVVDQEAIENDIIEPVYDVHIINSFGNSEYINNYSGKSFTINVSAISQGLHKIIVKRGNKSCSETFIKE